jgi:hypothetical protein
MGAAKSSFASSHGLTVCWSDEATRYSLHVAMVGAPPSFISQKHFRFAGEMLRRFLCQIILADPVEQWLATANLIEL